MTDKDLDNLVKNKLNEKTFEFNNAYWEQAEALLIAQRGAAKAAMLYKSFFYAASVGILALLSWFLVANQSTKTNGILASSNIETPKTNNDSPNDIIENKANTTNKTPITNQADKIISENNAIIPSKQPEKTTPESNSNPIYSLPVQKDNMMEEEVLADEIIIAEEGSSNNFLDQKQLALLTIPSSSLSFENMPISFLSKPEPKVKRSSILTQLNGSLEIGVNSFNSLLTSKSLGYYAGGRIYFDIGKISLNTNLHFEQIHQNTPSRNYIVKEYGFDSKTDETKVENESIQYAIIGLNAMYPFYKNHSLGMGVQYATLIQSNDKFTTINYETGNTNIRQAAGYSSVLNKNDWQLALHYQWRFAKKLAVNASYIYGLDDISKNELFKTTSNDCNRGVKLGLQYFIK